jgi:hypothetical protein
MSNSLDGCLPQSISTLSGYKEKSQIVVFEQLCHDAEVDDVLSKRRESMILRRSSIHGDFISYRNDFKDKYNPINTRRRRCHSSYNPRNRKTHRVAHVDLEEYLTQCTQTKNHHYKKLERSNIVNTLLDFHASFEISLAASSQPDVSLGLQYSCPVLSYLQDSDDDSVEVRIMKRSSLLHKSSGSLRQHQEDDFDIDTDDESVSQFMESEYIIEIPEMMEPEPLTSFGKQRRPHSYQILNNRLSSDSPLSVLRDLMQKEKEPSLLQPQELEDNIGTTSTLSSRIHPLNSQTSSVSPCERDCTRSLSQNPYAPVA